MRTLESSNVVSLLIKSILGCMLPQIFLCSCDCCGKGCGGIKYSLCLENSDFNSLVLKPSSRLKKNSAGEFILLITHEYYYQVQQQLFSTKLKYCYFVVCAVFSNELTLLSQRFLPDRDHWSKVVPNFGGFVFCLRYLLDGTQEERVL